MARRYERKTNRRPQDERHLSVRAEARETPDLQKLTELLIRLTLQESDGQTSREDVVASALPRR